MLASNGTSCCVDHLSCGAALPQCCPYVVNQLRYNCSWSMQYLTHKPSTQLISDFCPETCQTCGQKSTKVCIDNVAYKDANGQGCAAYQPGGSQHNQCFVGSAYVACPAACGSCGDCCGNGDGCFFSEKYVDLKSNVKGTRYEDKLKFGTMEAGVSFGVVEHYAPNTFPNKEVDGVFGMSWPCNQSQVSACLGSHEQGLCPSELVLTACTLWHCIGLGFGRACNPGCSDSSIDQYLDGQAMEKKIGLCLNENSDSSSMDLGDFVSTHYTGPSHSLFALAQPCHTLRTEASISQYEV